MFTKHLGARLVYLKDWINSINSYDVVCMIKLNYLLMIYMNEIFTDIIEM